MPANMRASERLRLRVFKGGGVLRVHVHVGCTCGAAWGRCNPSGLQDMDAYMRVHLWEQSLVFMYFS